MANSDPKQKLAVALAFIAAALGISAAIVVYFTTGKIAATPLFGGIFMLALGIGGLKKLRNPQP